MQPKLSRQLATVMFSDMVGYSELMDQNEDVAIAFRNRMENVLQELIPKYDGKILQFYGDGALSIFDSTVEAIQCAGLIQEAMQIEPVIPLRIGIHVGDMAFDEVNVYGETVNIASRIETFAVPGSVLFSEKVYDDLKNHPEIKARFMGEFELKNIRQPIRLYALVGTSLVTPDGLSLKGKGKASQRSIAVLPFTNMSSDPENEYFSVGMSEEILNIIAREKALKVTARTSSFAYKGQHLDVRKIGEELNVETVLEGSVRKVGNRVRITAQLISTSDGYHLLSETYDRTLDDIFAVQDEIATRISNKLKEKLGLVEEKVLNDDKPTENMEAYQLYLKGLYHWNKYDPKEAAIAINLFSKATQLDPFFGKAWAHLSFCYSYIGSTSTPGLLPLAEEAAQKAILIGDNLDIAYCAQGIVNLFHDWDFGAAEASFKNAKSINRHNPVFLYTYSLFLKAAGRFAKATKILEEAVQFDPLSIIAHTYLADAYFCQKDYPKALAQINRTLEKFPDSEYGILLKGLILSYMGKYEEAQEILSLKIDKANPIFKDFVKIRGANFQKMGNMERALGCIKRLEEMANQNNNCGMYYDLAMLYQLVGNTSKSFQNLEKAFELRYGGIIFLVNHPHWEAVRKDPAFKKLTDQMELDDRYVISI